MQRQFQVGCDIGGTFTDVVVTDSDGRVYTDKSDTTHGELTLGVVSALESVAGQLDLGLEEILRATTRFVNGTTIVTNSIAELRGARVGLITTKGMGDIMRIARSPRNTQRDHHLQGNVPDLVERDCIVEVQERVDRTGEVVVPLTAQEAERAVQALVEKEVESVAISLMWCFRNGAHEEMLASLFAERHPDLYVSVASRVHPLMREYERTVTTVLNAYTGIRVSEYTQEVERVLRERGLGVPVSLMQSFGGTLSAADARERPIALVDSGPAGGVVGTSRLARATGMPNLIAGDMGGTSFDVSVLANNEYSVTQRVMLREFLTGLSKIEIISVGAGGGSIGWIDARGVPQVGPRSAGSSPGPACYGRGGTEPTTTDAAVVLGLIDPETFLAGRRTLDADKAAEAIRTRLAEPLGTSVEEAAAAMHRLTVATMSNAVRSVTVERGLDPRDFVFCAYGGALGMFAADICRSMQIKEAIVPHSSSVFSAYGLLGTDDVRNVARSVSWGGDQDVKEVRETLLGIERHALEGLHEAGYAEQDIEIVWQGDFKFVGQLHDLTVPIPRKTELSLADLQEVRDGFAERFEAEYGEGTAWQNAPVILEAVRVIASASPEKFEERASDTDAGGSASPVGSRRVFRPESGGWAELPIYRAADLSAGSVIEGPAIVEHALTTIVIPEEWRLQVDRHGNYGIVDLAASGAAEQRQPTAATA
ncbi:MAG TPA: hydantoinase/oxoprolinase family protein [Solirubrobacteraceae bacterium]|jgi:N-methylhydantoinase A|nr:hydantoinase/oxoprolinase family protein [Solirubrobacteraceae bacterium]